MSPRSYTSPEAFKQALEQRLRQTSPNGAEFARRRQLLVFDRFLARVVAEFGDAVILKGGLVLELRLQRARTTKDVDLRLVGTPSQTLARLQAATHREIDDFMKFEVRVDDEHPQIQNEELQYDGLRFRVECKLAGKIYGQPFGVDIVFGDPIFGEPETIVADDTLAFAGIAPPTLRVYPVETHIAEKLHAYTMPRERPNSRIKDLPDIALLAKVNRLDARSLSTALEQTFTFRNTHRVPTSVPAPIDAWQSPYRKLAKEDQLQWSTLDEVASSVQAFLDPVLQGNLDATWDPDGWKWA